jgi:DNA-directed RNA polymerase specialized sigma24 family protein
MSGSVTQLILDMRNGSDAAAEDLWMRFQRRLTALAGAKLQRQGGIHDPDDIAIDAFYSFLTRHRDGKFHTMNSRDEAWKLLAVIVIRKAINAIKHSKRKRRFTDVECGDLENAIVANTVHHSQDCSIRRQEVAMEETFEQLLSMLKDQQLRDIATLKLRGISNTDIAIELSCSVATIERRLRLIRLSWENETNK